MTALGISWGSFCYTSRMTHQIYETGIVQLVDGTKLEISPLKLRYLIEFMDIFKKAQEGQDLIDVLIECTKICMKQFYPSIKTIEDVENNIDMPTIYDIVFYTTGIKLGHRQKEEQEEKLEISENEKSGWEDLDLNKLEAEVFLIGAWKNYKDLELSLTMPELLLTIESKRDLDYQEKKFLAAMQGVDLDENSGTNTTNQDPWEAMKARVDAKVSGIGSDNPNDITSFQGIRAAQAGFGIGMGLDYATDI